jgi:hypothetical protein
MCNIHLIRHVSSFRVAAPLCTVTKKKARVQVCVTSVYVSDFFVLSTNIGL